ncbi:MAG: hypothetical protein Q3999_00205 [Buchananella hordeovulneris]|nr:hypothetical protein [Buchananella hordeovulneris]
MDLLELETGRAFTLLALAEDVDAEEIEALAVSLDPEAGWLMPGMLHLTGEASLTGPWQVDTATRMALDLPAWTAQAYLLRCRAQRGGPLPVHLYGVDPLMDLFPSAVPAGTELVALNMLRRMARRLAGAVRVADAADRPGAGVFVPDPDSAVNMTVYAPIWLDDPAAMAVLDSVHLPFAPVEQEEPTAPSAARSRAENRAAALARAAISHMSEEEIAQLHARADAADAAALALPAVRMGYHLRLKGRAYQVDLTATGETHPPLVIQGEQWAPQGVVCYQLRWIPNDYTMTGPVRVPRSVRRDRLVAAQQIEAAATALALATGGRIVDEDGFLVETAA